METAAEEEIAFRIGSPGGSHSIRPVASTLAGENITPSTK
jgi:hypothetical protein